MYILIKNQEGENMNLLSQNTDFNALLAAMKADIEAEYEKATGSAINLDEDSGSDYEVGINVGTVLLKASASHPGICTAQTAILTGVFSK
jgi:hypothetical protein